MLEKHFTRMIYKFPYISEVLLTACGLDVIFIGCLGLLPGTTGGKRMQASPVAVIEFLPCDT